MQILEHGEFASETVCKQKRADLILVIQDKTKINMISLKSKAKEQQFLSVVKVCSLFTKKYTTKSPLEGNKSPFRSGGIVRWVLLFLKLLTPLQKLRLRNAFAHYESSEAEQFFQLHPQNNFKKTVENIVLS